MLGTNSKLQVMTHIFEYSLADTLYQYSRFVCCVENPFKNDLNQTNAWYMNNNSISGTVNFEFISVIFLRGKNRLENEILFAYTKQFHAFSWMRRSIQAIWTNSGFFLKLFQQWPKWPQHKRHGNNLNDSICLGENYNNNLFCVHQ